MRRRPVAIGPAAGRDEFDDAGVLEDRRVVRLQDALHRLGAADLAHHPVGRAVMRPVDHPVHVAAALAPVYEIAALDAVEEGRRDERLDQAGGLELVVLVDGHQLFAGGEVAHRPAGALVGGKAAVPAQPCDIRLDRLFQRVGRFALFVRGLRLAGRADGCLRGGRGRCSRCSRCIPCLPGDRRSLAQAGAAQQPRMGVRHPGCTLAIAVAPVDQAEFAVAAGDLQVARHDRAQHGAHVAAVVADIGRIAVPQIGHVMDFGA